MAQGTGSQEWPGGAMRSQEGPRGTRTSIPRKFATHRLEREGVSLGSGSLGEPGGAMRSKGGTGGTGTSIPRKFATRRLEGSQEWPGVAMRSQEGPGGTRTSIHAMRRAKQTTEQRTDHASFPIALDLYRVRGCIKLFFDENDRKPNLSRISLASHSPPEDNNI